MKAFFKQVLAALVALLLFTVALLLGLGAMLGGREVAKPVAEHTLLTLDLRVPIADRPPREELADLIDSARQGRARTAYTLREVVTAIDRAARDDRISGLFLKGRVTREDGRSGWAAMREVRAAIQRFRQAGKPVISWQEDLDEATLYVVSPAVPLMLHPLGMLEFNGLATELIYFRDAFDRYGVGVQAVRAGKFKSAVEPFVSSHMSEPNRLQLQALLQDLSHEMLTAIGASRGVEVGQLRSLADRQGLLSAQEARQAGLVTSLGYYDQVLERLRKLTHTKADAPIERQIDVADYFRTLKKKSGDKVAVIYVEGTIVSGDDESQVGADRLVRLLRKAARDEQVKAVVLRINSPGGSASAADVIEHEVRWLKEKKPVVVSMGSVAASGGYWIATHAHEIWLQPNTITGSIGVFGLFFNLQKLAGDHGLNREVVRTAAHADFDSLLRPKTPDELARVRRLVDGIYEEFLQRVAEGRGLSLQKVAELAQGRVWSGRQALRLGLADHEGGLREAIAAAARRADLKTYGIVEYQRAESWVDVLLRQLGLAPEEGGDARGRQMRSLLRALRVLFDYTDPKGVYARLPYDLHIH